MRHRSRSLTALGRHLVAATLLAATVVAVVAFASADRTGAAGIVTQDLGGDITAENLANDLLGGGITVSSVNYTGASVAAGRFTGGSGIIGFGSGIILSSGDIANVAGPNQDDGVSANNDHSGDPDLDELSGFTTEDAAVLQFDFVPQGSKVTFQYVFASEEYNEFVHSEFNDVFAFFINGVNCATAGGQPVSVNTINKGNPYNSTPKQNPALYRNNDLQDGGGAINTEMDGLTVVLSCNASVHPDTTNHMKLAIADASDFILDTNVFIKAGSFVVPTPTPSPTPSPTRSPTPSPTPAPTASPSPTPPPTATPTPSPSPSPAPSPTAAPTPTPTAAPTPAATPAPTAAPPPTLAPTPTPTPTPVAISASSTPAPTPTATATPRPLVAPPPAAPSPTPGPTATPKPSPSPTRSPAPSATPIALAAEQQPGAEDSGGQPGATKPGPDGGDRPEIIRSVLSPGDISGDPAVIATNLSLALLMLIVILLTATLFNQTVQENETDINSFFAPILAPVKGTTEVGAGAWRWIRGERDWLEAIGAPLVLLGLAGLIYGFAEPGFGLNTKSLVVFLSLILAFGGITYSYNGAQVLFTRRRLNLPAGIKLFPVGIAVAVFCVLLTRVDGFQPGIIYGFIASYAVMAEATLDRRQEGHTVFFPALVLLTVIVAAWFLVTPARDVGQDHSGWLAALPEGVLVGIFVGGLEGLFFNMIPLRFMDGYKVWNWSKGLWLLLAGVSGFLFWHVLLNKERDSFGAIQETTAATALIAMAICLTLSFGFWLFFRLRAERGPAPA